MSKTEVFIDGSWVEREPVEGEYYRETIETSEGPMYIMQEYVEIKADIAALRTERITQIKLEAQSRISALDWRLERARERAELGVSGQESVADVMQLREQIREASDAAEAAVNQLTSAEAIEAFQW